MQLRETAIDISLPELAELVDPWRMPTVPVASKGVPPHITLLYSWRPAPLRVGDINAVATAIAGIATFTLTFQQVWRFLGALFLSPEPEELLRSMTRRLAQAFPETPPYGGQFGSEPTPHLTIALAESEEELNRLQIEILECLEPRFPLQVPVHALSLEEEEADGTWQVVATIELRGS